MSKSSTHFNNSDLSKIKKILLEMSQTIKNRKGLAYNYFGPMAANLERDFLYSETEFLLRDERIYSRSGYEINVCLEAFLKRLAERISLVTPKNNSDQILFESSIKKILRFEPLRHYFKPDKVCQFEKFLSEIPNQHSDFVSDYEFKHIYKLCIKYLNEYKYEAQKYLDFNKMFCEGMQQLIETDLFYKTGSKKKHSIDWKKLSDVLFFPNDMSSYLAIELTGDLCLNNFLLKVLFFNLEEKYKMRAEEELISDSDFILELPNEIRIKHRDWQKAESKRKKSKN